MSDRFPNLLFVLADDLGQGDVSCFNDQAAWTTESMDRLAAEGMRFIDSHATSALCTPSRYSLLTGRYSWRSRLKRSVLPGDSLSLIEESRTILPQFLRDKGYKTAVVGKWHLGLDWHLRPEGAEPERYDLQSDQMPPTERIGRDGNFDASFPVNVEGLDIDYSRPIRFGPNNLGFDYSFITAASLDQPPYVYIENDRALGIPSILGGDKFHIDRRTSADQNRIQKGPMVPGYDVHKVAQDFQDKALEVLDEFLQQSEPWFFYVPSHLVHGPLIPNAPWRGKSGMGPYGDFVLQFDSYVGQLVERIDASNARNDTIVIVTSDNGFSGVTAPDELRRRGHMSSNGWRGRKSDIWEGGHREPFIVRWPNRIEAGSVSQHLISHSDIYATMADILKSPVPETAGEDSVSIYGLWTGVDKPARDDIVLQSGGGGLAIRQAQWKLAFTSTGDGMDARYDATQGGPVTQYQPAQLYDLNEDPGEQRNIIGQFPEVVERLVERLKEHIGRGRSTPGPELSNDPNLPTDQWPQVAWMDDPTVNT